MRTWGRIGLVVGAVLLLAVAFFIGRTTGGDSSDDGTVATTGQASASAFADLPTSKCKTETGFASNPVPLPAVTRAAVAGSASSGLAAYRDSAGTILVAPQGWECEAGIGVDGSQHIDVFPRGTKNPAEYPSHPGTVVNLQLIPGCQGCIAETVCSFFPKARVAQDYAGLGTKCPPKPLKEQVTHVSPATVLFIDPPKVEGAGVGSGGTAQSAGVLSFSERSGVHKVSCTLPADESERCAAIIGATFLAVPY